MKLPGKVAVVTGAGSGIGRAVALLFAQEGARVALVDHNEPLLLETHSSIQAAGSHGLVLCSDVGEPGTADRDAVAIIKKWGRIDILVTAAGSSCGGTVTTTAPVEWDAVYRAHVSGTWLWARAVIPEMQRQSEGTIVTLGSQLALAGGRSNSAYIAAKGAILSLTRTMALDYAQFGIRVNALVPGAISTPLLSRSLARDADPSAAAERSRQRHAMRRFGSADEVARGALFLAGDDSTFTTGSMLMVDGGWLAA